MDVDDDADAESEADADEINAAACGWNCGCSVNPIVGDAAAAATATFPLTNDTIAMTNANVSNIFDVVRIIRDALKLFSCLLNIVPTDILSFQNPPALKRKRKKNTVGIKSKCTKYSTIYFKNWCSCQKHEKK